MASNTFKDLGKATTTHDGSGQAITSTVNGDNRGLDVNVIGGDIVIENPELSVEIDAQDGDNIAIHNSSNGDEWLINPDGTGSVDVASTVLPPDAATETTLLDIKLDTAKIPLSPSQEHVLANDPHAVRLTDGTSFYKATTPTDTQPISAVSLPLPTGAATLAEQQIQSASLSVMDDWDESDRAKVNPIVGQAGVAAGSGVVGATTQRVTLATDVALPTGTNTLGSVKMTDGTDTALVSTAGEQLVVGNNVAGTTLSASFPWLPVFPAMIGTDPTSAASVAAPLRVSSTYNLQTNLINSVGSTAIFSVSSSVGGDTTNGLDVDVTRLQDMITDNAAFTDGTSKVMMAGYVFDETAGTALTENDAAAARLDSKRAQVLVIEDETTRGRRVTVTASNALKVDGSAVTQPVSGTITTKTALTASSPTFATVGVTSAQAVASNSSRKGLVLTNTSTGKISFGIGATAVLNSGITLTPGGVWSMDEYTFATGAINAIAEIASSNLAIQELT